MKCLSCDNILSDTESVRKFEGTNIFIDLCNKCLRLAGFNIETTHSHPFQEEEEIQTEPKESEE